MFGVSLAAVVYREHAAGNRRVINWRKSRTHRNLYAHFRLWLPWGMRAESVPIYRTVERMDLATHQLSGTIQLDVT